MLIIINKQLFRCIVCCFLFLYSFSINIAYCVAILFPYIYRGELRRVTELLSSPLHCGLLFLLVVSIVELKSAAERSLANATADLSNPQSNTHAASPGHVNRQRLLLGRLLLWWGKKPPKIQNGKAKVMPRRFAVVSTRYPYSLTVRLHYIVRAFYVRQAVLFSTQLTFR